MKAEGDLKKKDLVYYFSFWFCMALTIFDETSWVFCYSRKGTDPHGSLIEGLPRYLVLTAGYKFHLLMIQKSTTLTSNGTIPIKGPMT